MVIYIGTRNNLAVKAGYLKYYRFRHKSKGRLVVESLITNFHDLFFSAIVNSTDSYNSSFVVK